MLAIIESGGVGDIFVGIEIVMTWLVIIGTIMLIITLTIVKIEAYSK